MENHIHKEKEILEILNNEDPRSIFERNHLKKDKPFFSVIIPTYNQAEFLPFALDSVINQSFKNWEIVIVNDGSTDHTAKVMDRYAGQYSSIKQVHKENGGVATALTEGIQNASGEWICWLSSDDLFELDKLQIHYDAICKHPGIKFFQTHWSLLLEESGRKLKTSLWLPTPQPELETITFFKANYVHGNAITIHNSVFKEVGYFDKRFRQGQDFDMWLRISAKYPSHFIDKRTCITRIHKGQDTNAFPIGGVLDSAWSCAEFLNTHSFEDLFPLLDFTKISDIEFAISESFKIFIYQDAFINRGGYLSAFPKKIIDWVFNECQSQYVDRIRSFIKNQIQNYTVGRLPEEVTEILDEMEDLLNSRPGGHIFQKIDYLDHLIQSSKYYLSTGLQEFAEVLELYILKIQKSTLLSKGQNFKPEIVGFPRNQKYHEIHSKDIVTWDFFANKIDSNSITYKTKIHCSRCKRTFPYKAGFALLKNPQTKRLVCPNCKTGLKFSDAHFDSHFLKKQRHMKTAFHDNNNKKLIFVLRDTHVMGGGNIVIFNHIRWLHRFGYEIEIFSNSRPPDWVELPGSFHHVLSFEEIPEAGAEFVIIFSIFDLSIISRKYPYSKIVHFCQGYEGYHYGSDFHMMRSDKFIFDKLHSIPVHSIVVSKHLQNLFKDKFKRTSHLISNGVDHKIFNPEFGNRPEKHSILFIGSPGHPLKGFLFLARTIGMIQTNPDKKIDDLKLIVVSQMPDHSENHLKNDVASDINCRIEVKRNLSHRDIAKLMNQVGLLVCTSIYEGFSLPLLESMATGTPVITTNNMGAESFCIDGFNSNVVKYGDAEKFQELILGALYRYNIPKSQILNSIKTSFEYSTYNSVCEFIDTYEEVLNNGFDITTINSLKERYQYPEKTLKDIKTAINYKFPLLLEHNNGISTIIITAGTDEANLRSMIRSLRENTHGFYELVIINRENCQGIREYIQDLSRVNPFIRCLSEPEADLHSLKNKAVQISHGEFLVFIDEYLEFTPNWLPHLEKVVAKSSNIGLVAPVYDVDHSPQFLPGISDNFQQHSAFILDNYRKKDQKYLAANFITSHLFLIERKNFEIVGEYSSDPAFAEYRLNQIEFCQRCRKNDLSLIVDSSIFVHVVRNPESPYWDNFDILTCNKHWPGINFEESISGYYNIALNHQKLIDQSESLLAAGDYPSAINLLESNVNENPLSENGLLGLSMCYNQLGKLEKSHKYLQLLLKINPSSASAHNQNGILAAESGNLKKAENYFQKAVECDSTFIEAQQNLGEILLEMERYEDAVTKFMSILKLHPENLYVMTRMAQLHAEAGNQKESLNYVGEILRVDPENITAKELKGFLMGR